MRAAASRPRGPRTGADVLRQQRGQVLVIFALGLVALLAAAGFAFDIGRFYSERRALQNAADAAALAAANSLIGGGSTTDADSQARAILATNLAHGPNGIVAALPPATPVYADGGAGDPRQLVNGILISGGDVRVAIQNTIPYTFGRVVGLSNSVIGAQAHVVLDGNLLPIAVRRYINGSGPNLGATSPCPNDPSEFISTFSTADTACLGTDVDATQRTDPSPGAAFDSLNPGSNSSQHGPVVQILGQGAQPNNGADFRGFVALDIRNFQTVDSQLYYNGVTPSTNAPTLKSMEAGWISAGGYPGPMFPPVISPPDPNDQVAIMPGNTTGISIDAVSARFAPGDTVLVAVYPGQVMSIPDFTLDTPNPISLDPSGTLVNAGSFRVGRNQSFSGTVTLSTLPDANDPANPLLMNQITGSPPITYSPEPISPSLGAGTPVSMSNITTSGAAPGIYALWVKGEAGSPYLTTKYAPLAVQVGTVARDFTVQTDVSMVTSAGAGFPAVLSVAINNAQSDALGGPGVHLSLEGLAGPLPAGVSATFSSITVMPLSKNDQKSVSSTVSIDPGGLAMGTYTFVIRATWTNGESPATSVTHLIPFTFTVGTSGSTGNQSYVDINGFAVMRIAAIDSNTVSAYAITPVIADMNDPALRRGQVARLVPW
jgi:hypothetical protein